ncbi:MAG TPA: glycoside hydrolase [Anaerolineae bacterium]|nr:glycoside hydrolase [Anaerolineae bacterium]HIQ05515.1 glycoside hydrolase [Anaerolineae bacterium]
MPHKKIAVIGGGSAYCAGLIQSFIHEADAFAGCELALMDVDVEHLDLIHRLGQRMIAAAGANLHLTRTTDRQEAIDGADFVLTSFRVGGFEARVLDETIPLRYGVLGHETLGPGGFFYALRTLPTARGITEEMTKLAPDAVLINYTNPTNIVAEAVSHYSNVQVIGLCDQGPHDAAQVLGTLNMQPQKVEFWAAGLNHATWSTRFRADGEDVIPLMQERAAAVIANPAAPIGIRHIFQLTSRYGRMPSFYLQYYYFRDEMLAAAQARPTCRAEDILAELPAIWTHYREQAERERPVLTHTRGGSGFGDLAVDVLKALIHDTGDVFILNVPNGGALPEFPPDRIVEVPCRVDALGPTPLAQPPLAAEVRGLLLMLSEYQALAAHVGWEGTRREAILALASNPLVLSLSKAEALYDDLAAAHQRYLPRRLW